MKPSFALSLSFEGIDLLHRAPDGWRAVGSVGFDDQNISSKLDQLREKALTLSPEGVSAKLVLPEEQIKYLTLPLDPGNDPQDIAERALEGATPYSLDELAIDCQLQGDQLFVAAVARETLAEAEAFAHDHQFNPVSFVANPTGDFPGEPFFGGTHGATELFGGPVARDDEPIAVIGPALYPAPAATEPVAPGDAQDTAAEVADPGPAADDEVAAEDDSGLTPISAPDLPLLTLPEDGNSAEAAETPATQEAPNPAEDGPVTGDLDASDESKPAPQQDTGDKADEPVEAPLIEEITAPRFDLSPPDDPGADPSEGAPPVEAYAPPAPPKPADPLDVEDELAPAMPLSAAERELIEAIEKQDNVEIVSAPSLDGDAPSLPVGPTGEGPPPEPPRAGAEDAPTPPGGANPPAAATAAPADTPAAQGAMMFSSVRARRDLPDVDPAEANRGPKLGGATRDPLSAGEPVRRLSLTPDRSNAETPPRPAEEKTGDGRATMLGMADSLKPDAAEGTPPDAGPRPGRQPVTEAQAPPPLTAPGAATAPAALAAPGAARPDPPLQRPLTPAEIAARNAESAPIRAPQKAGAFGKDEEPGFAPPFDEAAPVGGKPRYLGLVLTALLLLFMVAVAGWASFSERGFAGLFGLDTPEQTELALETSPLDSEPLEDATEGSDGEDLAALPLPPVEGSAVSAVGAASETDAQREAATDPELAALNPELDFEPESPAEPGTALPDPEDFDAGDMVETGDTPEEMAQQQLSTEERYATTGIWQAAPDQPGTPQSAQLGDPYMASIDPDVSMFDAVALPDPQSAETDAAPAQRSSPAAPGTTFDMDQRGLVEATPEGALTPDGILVYAGYPPIRPPNLPERQQAEPEGISDAEKDRLSTIRPRSRPDDLIEKTERSQLGGRTLNELADIRPRSRPVTFPDPDSGTDPAVTSSNRLALLNNADGPLINLTGEPAGDSDRTDSEAIDAAVAAAVQKPRARPSNFQSIVERSNKADTQVASAARSQPRIPTAASVARQATVKNQINLRKVNLIGIYGKASDRRALIRLASGRYKKVKVGDRIDGGRIQSIGESELRYTKGGRTLTLQMPRG